jgi:hypothetical protein
VLVPDAAVDAGQEVVEARDAVVRLFRRVGLAPLTARVLWDRACGVDVATLGADLGVTRTQAWELRRRGVAALAIAAGGDEQAA